MRLDEERYAFHAAPKSKENKIKKEGLKLYGGRIYLTNNRKNIKKWCNILSKDHNINNFTVFEVDISNIPYIETPGDTTEYPREIIIEESIDPSRLLKIKEININS